MSQQDVDKYSIEPCSCGEKEFLQILLAYQKPYVHCVNCGNRSCAMSTEEKTVDFWNRISRFETIPED